MAYAFMTGLPGPFSRGFSMMSPAELKRERVTYVKYWMKRLRRDMNAIANSG